MHVPGQTALAGTALPITKPSALPCARRGRSSVMRAVAAPTKLDTRKSEQACANHSNSFLERNEKPSNICESAVCL